MSSVSARWFGWILLAGATSAPAQDIVAISPSAAMATVDGRPILFSDLVQSLQSAAGEDVDVYSLPQSAYARALEIAIDRSLIHDHLRLAGRAAVEAEVDRAVALLEQQLEIRGRDLPEHLEKRRMGLSDLRAEFAWKIAWRRFAADELSDERLRELAAGDLREYDGRRRAVRHILFRDQALRAGDESALLNQANRVREQIAAGREFADAAREYSQAPSAAEGGDLGLIGREGPMVEAFSSAAFALKIGEVSEPVATEFGVHLILCTAEEPGEGDLESRLPVLRIVAERELFAQLAAKLRRQADVQYGDEAPESWRAAPSSRP